MSGRPNTKWKETMVKRFGSEEALSEHMKKQGSKGGSASSEGGFGSQKPGKDGLTGPQRARKVGKIGGHISRRRPKTVVE